MHQSLFAHKVQSLHIIFVTFPLLSMIVNEFFSCFCKFKFLLLQFILVYLPVYIIYIEYFVCYTFLFCYFMIVILLFV